MKKILLIIKTSNGGLYKKTTQVQLDTCKKWQKKTSMNIDMVAITSGPENKQEGEFLYVKCDDKDLFTKHCLAVTDYIMRHPEYDTIITINTCTAINLEFMFRFINNEFNNELIYGHGFVSICDGLSFLPGTFIMCSRDFYIKYLSDKDMAIKARDTIPWKLSDKYHPNDTVMSWEGVAEDSVYGRMLQWQHKTLVKLPSVSTRDIVNFNGDLYYDQDLEHLNISPIFDLHLNIPYNERSVVEPMMLKLAMMYWMEHPLTDEEYNTILYNSCIFKNN